MSINVYDKFETNIYNEIERWLPGGDAISTNERKTAMGTITNGDGSFIRANDLFSFDPHKYKRHVFHSFALN